jgi:hypothetical protein
MGLVRDELPRWHHFQHLIELERLFEKDEFDPSHIIGASYGRQWHVLLLPSTASVHQDG